MNLLSYGSIPSKYYVMYKIADSGSSRFQNKVRFKLNKIAKGMST